MTRVGTSRAGTGSTPDRPLHAAALLELLLAPGVAGDDGWRFVVPAIALLVLPLLFRRWFPFAAPAAYWVLAPALSFVDGRLIPLGQRLFLVGLASAFLLGNLATRGRRGSASS